MAEKSGVKKKTAQIAEDLGVGTTMQIRVALSPADFDEMLGYLE